MNLIVGFEKSRKMTIGEGDAQSLDGFRLPLYLRFESQCVVLCFEFENFQDSLRRKRLGESRALSLPMRIETLLHIFGVAGVNSVAFAFEHVDVMWHLTDKIIFWMLKGWIFLSLANFCEIPIFSISKK